MDAYKNSRGSVWDEVLSGTLTPRWGAERDTQLGMPANTVAHRAAPKYTLFFPQPHGKIPLLNFIWIPPLK